MAIDITFKYKTPLESSLLAKPFMGLSHEGWVHNPQVTSTATSITIKNISFFYAGRSVVNNESDVSATKRLFHVSSVDGFSIPNLDPLDLNTPVAIGFRFPFIPNEEISISESLFMVVRRNSFSLFSGFLLGRLLFFDGVWHLFTDCADFADKYFIDNNLCGSRVSAMSIKGSANFVNSRFIIKHYNDVIEQSTSFLPLFANSGDSVGAGVVSVILDSTNGVTINNPVEGYFYALGFKSSVSNVDRVDGQFKLNFSVLGSGLTFDEAISSCLDSSLYIFHSPLAVVQWFPSESIIHQYKPVNVTVTRKFSLAADVGTGTDISTPAVSLVSVGEVLQIIWGKIRQVVNALSNASNIKVTLTDASESSTLPSTTANTAVSTLLQTIRNNLKHLFDNKSPANASLSADTGTGTDITTPAVSSNTIANILQTIWGKIRQVANAKVDKINITAVTSASALKVVYNAQGQITSSTGLSKSDLALGNVLNVDTTNADNVYATLTDASGSSTLPSTTSNSSIPSLLQTIRNNLKHLFNDKLSRNETLLSKEVIALIADNQENALSTLYGGTWYKVVTPAPRRLYYASGTGSAGELNFIVPCNTNGGAGFLIPLGCSSVGSIVTVEISTTIANNDTVFLTSSLLDNFSDSYLSYFVLTGISGNSYTFPSVTLGPGEQLYLVWSTNINFSGKVTWTAGCQSITEYLYVRG